MPQLKILYASDFHGSTIVFRKFVNASLMYKVDYSIYGGDISGKYFVPILRRKDYFEAYYLNKKHVMKENELQKFVEKIENSGGYTIVVEENEYEKINTDQSYADRVFKELMESRLKSWLVFAEDKLKDKDIQLLLQLGNDDEEFLAGVIKELESSKVRYVENKIEPLKEGYELASLGYANITPWKCPRDVEEPILEGMLTKLMSQVQSFEKTILNTHCPPYNTNIDLAPKLVDFKPVITSGGVVMEHVGCKSVRNIIERYQPLIGLHGHIHESRGVDKIGRTLVLNPGSDYNVGVLRAAYIVLEGSKVKSYLLVSG